MIERIRFKNFKALKDAEIKLGPFNLIVGPNGSGKSSVLQAFETLREPARFVHRTLTTVGCENVGWSIDIHTSKLENGEWVGTGITHGNLQTRYLKDNNPAPIHQNRISVGFSELQTTRVYSLEPTKMTQAVSLHEVRPLDRDGSNLCGFLTYIRDRDEDAYNKLRDELQRWLPEFDAISFDSSGNSRSLLLRQTESKKKIPAQELSEGTLLALALVAISHQPEVPAIIGLEEPDRALHPRLLREVRDALYRLAFPSDYGLNRAPVQIIATTHSPYFLDLFRDHPEQIIVAEKKIDGTVKFRSLSDEPNLREIIGDAPLGEVWYSGILGGVPAGK